MRQRSSTVTEVAAPTAAHGPAGVLASLLAADAALSQRAFSAYGHTTGVGRRRLRFLERLGQGWLWFGFPIAVLLLVPPPPFTPAPPSFTPLDSLRRDASLLLAAMLLDLACVAALKAITRRPRPGYNLPDTRVVGPDRYSFPSGHASRCALLALMAADCASPALGGAGAEGAARRAGAAAGVAAVFAWAGLTAACRVTMGRHHALDVAAGLVLGAAEAAAVRRAARSGAWWGWGGGGGAGAGAAPGLCADRGWLWR